MLNRHCNSFSFTRRDFCGCPPANTLMVSGEARPRAKVRGGRVIRESALVEEVNELSTMIYVVRLQCMDMKYRESKYVHSEQQGCTKYGTSGREQQSSDNKHASGENGETRLSANAPRVIDRLPLSLQAHRSSSHPNSSSFPTPTALDWHSLAELEPARCRTARHLPSFVLNEPPARRASNPTRSKIKEPSMTKWMKMATRRSSEADSTRTTL